MVNFVYNEAAYKIADQSLQLETSALKLLLINDSYTPNRDDVYIDEGGTHDVKDAEITPVTNYARKDVQTNRLWTKVGDPDNYIKFDADDPTTWANLGGAVNDTIEAAILVIDTGDDATSLLVAYYDTTSGTPSLPFLTTGGDFSININANGLINLDTQP